jgi:NOL1/NOP2/fmu family ribosome biogenesis protein
VASESSGSAIRRPNGAGSLRRSDSIRNNCRADPRSLNYRGAKRGITLQVRQKSELRAQVRSNFVLKPARCHSACNIDPLSRGIGVQN